MTAYSVFVDTNVLVYQTFEDFEPAKHESVTTTLQQLHEHNATLYIRHYRE